jgi:hypothetical protein
MEPESSLLCSQYPAAYFPFLETIKLVYEIPKLFVCESVTPFQGLISLQIFTKFVMKFTALEVVPLSYVLISL